MRWAVLGGRPIGRPYDNHRKLRKPSIMRYDDQYTLPSRSAKAAQTMPSPAPAPRAGRQPHVNPPDPTLLRGPRRTQANNKRSWLLIGLAAALIFSISTVLALMLFLLVVYGGGILPNVSVGGVSVGNLSQAEAANVLRDQWRTLILRDGQRTWEVEAAALGLSLDAAATARQAFRVGRGGGSGLTALFQDVSVAPVVNFEPDTLRDELDRMADTFAIPAVNAGVSFANGRVEPTPAQAGQRVDANGTALALLQDPLSALLGGELSLVMQPVQPEIRNVSALVSRAQALLNNPLEMRLYDAVTGDSIDWLAMPQQWGAWLEAQPDPSSDIGLAITMRAEPLRDYLRQQAASLGDGRSIDIDAAAADVQQAIANNRTDTATFQVQHLPRTHVVQPGETITSIAWDYGIPYPYIQQANNGLEFINAGQSITIPPADTFLLYPALPDKRIVVDISEQRTRVYENGQLKWDWLSSTGISDSPTWPGVYQVISQVPNAYAANWNLYMPNFIGVYQPVPNADFTNGFHGYPTRGGGQLLWRNALGRRVTYGCILLDDANVRLLYDWVEQGVVVEIRP